MSEMVNRVAARIGALTPMDDGDTLLSALGKPIVDEIAQAAIAAMREPTKEMVEAAMQSPIGCEILDRDSLVIWQAMIDGALRDQ